MATCYVNKKTNLNQHFPDSWRSGRPPGQHRGGRPGIPGIGSLAPKSDRLLGEIYYYPPAAVFIMIGVNDINAAGKTPEFTAENIFKIVDLIRGHSPKTKVYVQTILPTSKEEVAAKIRKANALLRMKASQHRYTLIDLHKDFADDNGLLKKEFSADGIHLKEAGYQEWVEKEGASGICV
ncbi:MAG: hypothetical protein GX615_14605 [Lentisphaerae bacterium]|nr:hypothetical protein [Lentisphaerota bacterium]